MAGYLGIYEALDPGCQNYIFLLQRKESAGSESICVGEKSSCTSLSNGHWKSVKVSWWRWNKHLVLHLLSFLYLEHPLGRDSPTKPLPGVISGRWSAVWPRCQLPRLLWPQKPHQVALLKSFSSTIRPLMPIPDHDFPAWELIHNSSCLQRLRLPNFLILLRIVRFSRGHQQKDYGSNGNGVRLSSQIASDKGKITSLGLRIPALTFICHWYLDRVHPKQSPTCELHMYESWPVNQRSP